MSDHPGDLLSAYVDGELTDSEESTVVAHLDACRDCRRELAEVQSARAVTRGLPVLSPRRELTLPSAQRRRAVVALGAVAVLIVAVLGLAQLEGEPADQQIDLASLTERHAARAILDPGPKPNKVAGTVSE